jgi:hypothetical protein
MTRAVTQLSCSRLHPPVVAAGGLCWYLIGQNSASRKRHDREPPSGAYISDANKVGSRRAPMLRSTRRLSFLAAGACLCLAACDDKVLFQAPPCGGAPIPAPAASDSIITLVAVLP